MKDKELREKLSKYNDEFYEAMRLLASKFDCYENLLKRMKVDQIELSQK